MGAKTLWSDASRSRQFLIPDAFQLPAGDYLLRTATGREQYVDPAALSKFEVSNEEANTWLKEQLGEVMKKLGAGLRESLSGKPSKDGATNEIKEPVVEDEVKKTKSAPGLDLLAGITATPRENLNADYVAIGKAFRIYLEDMVNTAINAASGEPERVQAARERMRQWAETLREHGISSPDVTGQSPAASASTDPSQTPNNTPATEACEAPANTELGGSFSERLRELAENFRRRADVLAAAREKKILEPASVDDKNVSRSKNFDSTRRNLRQPKMR